MNPRTPWPRSLAGQMALLVAIALFVAQAINLAMLLRDRATFRVAQMARPAAIRIADALDRDTAGRPMPARRRVRRLDRSWVTPGMTPQPRIAAELRDQLVEQGITVGRIEAAVAPVSPVSDDDAPHGRWRRARHTHDGQTLVIAVEQARGRWLGLVMGWPGADTRLLWRLIAQTLLLYGAVLLPVLWIARRISRPLRALAVAAHDFAPGDPPAPIVERGPPDVRAVIAAVNALQLRVTAMLDEKDRMLGAIGHDLRTPLAALRVRIESVEDEQDRLRMADTIAEMNRTLDDILSLARLGRPSEPVTETDVAALVDAVVEDFRDLDRDVAFAETGRIRIRLRPSLTRRAVRNLIENAVKYAGSAEVSIAAEATQVAIHVADRGPGIPANRLEDVFTPFTRIETSRNRETGGIGLGLALARAIVQEAGGRIDLSNRAGGGLLATIILPRRA